MARPFTFDGRLYWAFLSESPGIRALVGALFLVALGFAIGRLSRSKPLRPTAFGLAWFALASLAVSTRGAAADGPIGNPAFLPYVGLTLAFVWSAAYGMRRLRDRGVPAVRPVAACLALAVVAVHAVATYQRNPVWRDDETLWSEVLRHGAEDGQGLLNHGRALLAKGRHDEALESLERARLQLSGSSVLERNQALARDALGQREVAEALFRRALELEPRDARSHGAFARWLVTEGRGPEAIEHLKTAARTGPNDARIRWLLMNLHAASGNDAALEAEANATLAILPTDDVALAYTSGRIPIRASAETAAAYARLGRENSEARYWVDAAVTYRHAATLDPSASRLRSGLGWARMQLGFFEGAIVAYREALAIEPTRASVWNDLGWAQAQLGRFDEAIPSFEAATELDPSMSRARNNLAWARKQSAAAADSGGPRGR